MFRHDVVNNPTSLLHNLLLGHDYYSKNAVLGKFALTSNFLSSLDQRCDLELLDVS